MGDHPLAWLGHTAYEFLRWAIDLGLGAIQPAVHQSCSGLLHVDGSRTGRTLGSARLRRLTLGIETDSGDGTSAAFGWRRLHAWSE